MMLKSAQDEASRIACTILSSYSKILPTHFMVLLCEFGREQMRSVPRQSAISGGEPSQISMIPRMRLIGFHTACHSFPDIPFTTCWVII